MTFLTTAVGVQAQTATFGARWEHNAVKYPAEVRTATQKIAWLLGVVTNGKAEQDDRPLVYRSIVALGRLGAVAAASVLAEKLSHRVARTEAEYFVHARGDCDNIDAYLAMEALMKLGRPSLRAVIAAAASSDHSPQPLFGNTLYLIHVLVDSEEDGRKSHNFILRCAHEYRVRARRLRDLASPLRQPITVKPAVQRVVRGTAAVKSFVPTNDAVAAMDRLARVLTLQSLLRDNDLQTSNEVEVIHAARELGSLRGIEGVGDLVDKLDFEAQQPRSHDLALQRTLSAAPEGLQSLEIAKAATQALLSIGRPSLPCIVEALSMSGRGVRFAAKVMPVIFTLTGDPWAVHEILMRAAGEDDQKAKRLTQFAVAIPHVW